MKTKIISATVLCIFFCSGLYAQQSLGVKQHKDPSYSVHNYKHPNKARVAKEMKAAESNPQQFVIVNEYVDAPIESRSNYKVPRKARRNYLFKHRDTKAINIIVVEADENQENDSNDVNYFKENTKVEN
jgi:hypothetical protein